MNTTVVETRDLRRGDVLVDGYGRKLKVVEAGRLLSADGKVLCNIWVIDGSESDWPDYSQLCLDEGDGSWNRIVSDTYLRIVKGENLTAGATVRDGIVVASAPILRRFVGQSAENLKRWADRWEESE